MNIRGIRGYLFSALAAAGLLAAGCGSTPAGTTSSAPKDITIGTLYAASGNFATSSLPELAGLKFWASQANAQGGVFVKAYGRKIPIKLVTYNDQSDPTTAQTQYTQLINQNHVNILVSDFGSVLTSVAVPIAQENKMVLFDPTGTGASFFTPNNPYIVLTALPTSAVWPDTLAQFLIQKGIRKVAIIYAENDFDQSQAQTLATQLGKVGIQPVYNNGVPTSTANYTVLIHSIAATHPDAVVEFGYPNNDIAFLQNLAASGQHFNFLFTVFPGQLLSLMEQNVGVKTLSYTFTYPTPPQLAYNKVTYGMGLSAFEQAMQKSTGQSVNFLDIAGYNTGLAIQKTLETAKSLSQLDLRAAAGKISMFTLDGQFKINSEGAQLGETLPVGQLQPSGSSLTPVIVFPSSVATGTAVYPAPSH